MHWFYNKGNFQGFQQRDPPVRQTDVNKMVFSTPTCVQTYQPIHFLPCYRSSLGPTTTCSEGNFRRISNSSLSRRNASGQRPCRIPLAEFPKDHPVAWEETGLNGGVKGVVLAEIQTVFFFFGRISGASSCLSAGPLFTITGIITRAARQAKRNPREPGDRCPAGLCCRVSAGGLAMGAGGCLRCRKGGTPLSGLPFQLPPVDPSDTGCWKAATTEGVTRRSCPAGSGRCFSRSVGLAAGSICQRCCHSTV